MIFTNIPLNEWILLFPFYEAAFDGLGPWKYYWKYYNFLFVCMSLNGNTYFLYFFQGKSWKLRILPHKYMDNVALTPEMLLWNTLKADGKYIYVAVF